MAVKVITAPVDFPVTLAQAKAHLRVDHTDDDSLINQLIASATGHAEAFMGRALMTQTLELVLDNFPAQIQVPKPPLQSVMAVRYDDGEGVEQTLTEVTDYAVDNVSQPGWIVPVNSTWPGTLDAINSVRIRYVAGYVNSTVSPPVPNVPEDIKSAILLIIGSLYAFRETMVVGTTAGMMPWSAEQLMRRHRIDLSMA